MNGKKQDGKPSDNQYGDAILWMQLLDHANMVKKPVVFVTSEKKEDWWQRTNGQTLGPRPEMIQEMYQHCGQAFYLYRTPRFLEEADQYFNQKTAEAVVKEVEEVEKERNKQERVLDVIQWLKLQQDAKATVLKPGAGRGRTFMLGGLPITIPAKQATPSLAEMFARVDRELPPNVVTNLAKAIQHILNECNHASHHAEDNLPGPDWRKVLNVIQHTAVADDYGDFIKYLFFNHIYDKSLNSQANKEWLSADLDSHYPLESPPPPDEERQPPAF